MILSISLTAVLIASFYTACTISTDTLEGCISVYKAVVPVFFSAVAFASGNVTAAVYYEIVLMLITTVNLLFKSVLIKVDQIYMLISMADAVAKEERFTKAAELCVQVMKWSGRTALVVFTGLGGLKGMLVPVSETYKKKMLYRAVQTLPGVGSSIETVTQTVWGAAKIIKNGIIDENPTFSQVIGMCPTLAVTTSFMNGLGMGLSTTAVLICSNIAISLIRKIVPDQVRIPCFIVVIAGFVTLIQMLLKAYVPALNASLGMFIPLIVVNCIILGRAEAYASKNSPIASLFDGLGMGLGFTLALSVLGIVRELLGSGSIFGYTLPEIFPRTILMILPPGAFFTLSFLMVIFNLLKNKKNA